MGSFLAALALHGAVLAAALWLHLSRLPPDDAAMDALLVELAPAPQAPPSPPRELAPGPVQQRSEPRPEPTPQPPVAEPPATPMPPVERVVLEDPAVVDPMPRPPSRQATAEAAQDAAQASAHPSVDAHASETYAAPRTVVGNSRAAVDHWHGLLLAHLERHRRYPRQAERRGEQGVSYVRFDVDHLGRVANPEIARGSGHALLDAEALVTVRRASPVPPPPDVPPGGVETVVVPVQFFMSR